MFNEKKKRAEEKRSGRERKKRGGKDGTERVKKKKAIEIKKYKYGVNQKERTRRQKEKRLVVDWLSVDLW